MWNDGFYILWSHITAFYFNDLDSGLRMLSKLPSDHFNLSPYSVMRVHLAAQVLSNTVWACINKFWPPEASATAKFCIMIDQFFWCSNVKNTVEHIAKKKPFLKPYSGADAATLLVRPRPDNCEWLRRPYWCCVGISGDHVGKCNGHTKLHKGRKSRKNEPFELECRKVKNYLKSPGNIFKVL